MQASDIYGNLKDTANAIAYIEKCIPYIEHTDSFGKANIYSGLANIYNVKGDFEKAKKYGDMSINLRPKHDTYYILSKTYKNKGDMATADTMIKQAIKTATPNYKMMMMAEIRKEKQGQGRYKDAAALGDSMMSLNNSITRRNQADSIIEIQATFDIAQKDRQQIAKLKHGIICIAIVAIALIAISIMKQYTQNALFKRKIRKAKHELQAIIDNYSEFKNILYNTLNAAAESNKGNAEDGPKAGQPEERPQETMAQAPNRAEGIAPEARQCLAEMYEMTDYVIINNNCIAKWSNDKTARFIGYCCCAIPGLNGQDGERLYQPDKAKQANAYIHLPKQREGRHLQNNGAERKRIQAGPEQAEEESENGCGSVSPTHPGHGLLPTVSRQCGDGWPHRHGTPHAKRGKAANCHSHRQWHTNARRPDKAGNDKGRTGLPNGPERHAIRAVLRRETGHIARQAEKPWQTATWQPDATRGQDGKANGRHIIVMARNKG